MVAGWLACLLVGWLARLLTSLLASSIACLLRSSLACLHAKLLLALAYLHGRLVCLLAAWLACLLVGWLGWLAWLAGWLACLPACLLACCLAALLGFSVAQLLACFLAWLACLLATCLAGWIACLLTCLLASLCAPREGGRAVQHRHTCGERMRDRRSQDFGKADNNTGTHVGRQWETRVDKTSGRRTHHPTRAHMWGDKGRQDLGKADRPSNKGKREGRQGETRGPGRADTPSNKGKQEGRQDLGHTIQQKKTRRETMRDKGKHWEAKGDKVRQTSKKWAHYPTHAHM